MRVGVEYSPLIAGAYGLEREELAGRAGVLLASSSCREVQCVYQPSAAVTQLSPLEGALTDSHILSGVGLFLSHSLYVCVCVCVRVCV